MVNDWKQVPDKCLLFIAKKSWNNLEPDEKLDIWNEVISRWESCIRDKEAEAIANKHAKGSWPSVEELNRQWVERLSTYEFSR